MISSIHMKNCATYNEEGTKLENCNKINFIYGANGSGKTTISNFLTDINSEKYKDCVVDGNLNDYELLVYNKEFKDKNFLNNMRGVFTLGQDSIEDREKLNSLGEDRECLINQKENLNKTLQLKREELTKEQNIIYSEIWKNIYKIHSKELDHIFDGKKSSKKKMAEFVLSFKNFEVELVEDFEELLTKYNVLYKEKTFLKHEYKNITSQFSNKILLIEQNKVWEKQIIGNNHSSIAKLINKLDNSDWVNQGRIYLNNNGICPFCQEQSITAALSKEIEMFFNEEYTNDIKLISELYNDYIQLFTQLISYLKYILKGSNENSIAEIDQNKLRLKIEKLEKLYNINKDLMLMKINKPSKSISINNSFDLLEKTDELIIDINFKIREINQICKNKSAAKIEYHNKIWNFITKENIQKLNEYKKELKGFEKAIKNMESTLESLDDNIEEIQYKIKAINSNMTSISPTINKINSMLESFGFDNFKIVESLEEKNTYQIQRMDGSLVNNTLSEGEQTFITFLYYIELLNGSTEPDNVSKKKIIIIDDPICSLDCNILYIVSNIVKNLILNVKKNKEILQIFILTHNVFFHKESAFINNRTNQDADVNYWIIEKKNNISIAKAYERVNPIKTTYQLMWEELKDINDKSLISVQNVMRRIIENYFSMLGNSNKINDMITKKFVSEGEKIVCRSLISYINDGSHTIYDDFTINSYSDSVSRYLEVFEKIFSVTGHKAHYDMMMAKE